MNRTHLQHAAALATWAALAASVVAPGCSLQNRDGPVVTCEELECGRINACSNGIIAQCVDGQNVRYHVCDPGDDEICDEEWQVPGAYRCQESATDCEGCRTERFEGCAWFDTGQGGTSTTGGTSTSGMGGMMPASGGAGGAGGSGGGPAAGGTGGQG